MIAKTGMSSQCVYYNTCKKHMLDLPRECKDRDVWCLRVAKLQQLYSSTLLSPAQYKPIQLQMNSNAIDYPAFLELTDISKSIEKFVKEGKNLFLYSRKCGNGKTSWAIKLLQDYLGRSWVDLTPEECHALFIHVPTFLIELKNNISNKSAYAQHIIDNARTAQLVVWDEIGTKELTPFENEHMLSFINYRLDAGLTNIYTSNLDPESLRLQLKDRMFSRIVSTAVNIEFNSDDKRGFGPNDSKTIYK